jgi:hypothetical protein
MIKKLKNLVLSMSLLGLFAAPVLATAGTVSALDCTNAGSASIKDCLSVGTCLSTSNDNGCGSGAEASGTVDKIIKLVINIFSLVVGVVAVIMIIVGGLKYITSSGDSGNVTGAKNTILYAIIGLVVVALAQVIVRFVLNKVNGT